MRRTNKRMMRTILMKMKKKKRKKKKMTRIKKMNQLLKKIRPQLRK